MDGDESYERFHTVLSLLAYLMKAPLVPEGTPVVNALAAQRQVSSDIRSVMRITANRLTLTWSMPNIQRNFIVQCIVNVFRACVGLPAENFMQLEHKVRSIFNLYLELHDKYFTNF